MAKYSDIIKNVNERSAAGDLYLDPRLAATAEKVYAPTDELAADSLIAQYPNQFEGVKVAGDKAILPDLSTAASIVGLVDVKGGKTKEEQFIEQFPEKMKEWKAEIIADEKMGTRGWNSIYDAWKAASNAKMLQDIRSGREEFFSGPKFWPTKIFTPRRYESYVRGDDPSWQDTAGDFVENAAYMVPGATFSKIINAGNRAANAGKFLIGVASAPAIAEAFDAATRGDDDPNVDRRDFSFGDVAMGAATNAFVNYGLRRYLSQLYQRLFGEGARGKAREVVENIGKSSYAEGKEALARAAEEAKLPRVSEGQLSPETLNGGIGGVRSIGEAAGKQAEDFVKFSQIVDNLNYMPKMEKGANIHDVAEYLASTPETKSLVQRVLEGPYAKDAMNILHGNKLTPREKFNDIMQQALGSWGVNKYGSRRDADVGLSALGGASYGIANIIGEDIDPKAVQKFARKEHEEFERKEASKRIDKAVKGASLNDEDKIFIDIIRKNPNVMKFGIGDDQVLDKRFKLWLIDRGNNILMQTGLVRPTWQKE